VAFETFFQEKKWEEVGSEASSVIQWLGAYLTSSIGLLAPSLGGPYLRPGTNLEYSPVFETVRQYSLARAHGAYLQRTRGTLTE
jgi:hypothetical protein